MPKKVFLAFPGESVEEVNDKPRKMVSRADWELDSFVRMNDNVKLRTVVPPHIARKLLRTKYSQNELGYSAAHTEGTSKTGQPLHL
jgi:hypothetical protein